MMVIQGLVILIALAILFFGLSGRTTHRAKAGKKIGIFLLVIAMIGAVLSPGITNELAHAVGVGRGADLLLYVLTLSFIVYVLNNYVQQQREKDTLYRLARKIALVDANERYNIRKR